MIAGITLAAYAIPVSLAYATLAGLPPQFGIYCYLVGGVGYAALRHFATVGDRTHVSHRHAGWRDSCRNGRGDPTRSAAIASLTAPAVAVLGGLAWLLRLSGLISFISETILTGFKAGAALTIALTQFPKLFGVPGGGENFFERVWILLQQLGETNVVVLALGLGAISLLLLGEKLLPGRPVALFVVASAIATVSLTSSANAACRSWVRFPPGCPNSLGHPYDCAMWTESCR